MNLGKGAETVKTTARPVQAARNKLAWLKWKAVVSTAKDVHLPFPLSFTRMFKNCLVSTYQSHYMLGYRRGQGSSLTLF